MLSLVLLFIVLWAYYEWKRRSFVKVNQILKHKIRSLPFFGVSHLFVGDGKVVMRGIDKLGKEALDQGGIISISLAHKCFIVIADPDLANYVSKTCLEKHEIMKTCTRILFGNAHIIAPVPIWRRNRKIALPLFTSSKIKTYVPVMKTQSKVMIEKLRPTVGKPVFVFDTLLRQTFETLGQVSLDLPMDFQNTKEHPFLTGFEVITKYVGERFFKPWLHYDLLYELLPEFRVTRRIKDLGLEFVNEGITSKRSSLKVDDVDTKGTGKMKSFVEQYLSLKGDDKLNDEEMGDELISLLLAGTDTTTISASFCVSLLARFPEVQDRLYQEIVEHADNGFCEDDVFNLKYLDAFIKETLRLFPPVPVVVREVDNDVTLPSGVVLPEGCGILLHIWAINRNPQYWGPDAEEFRPERFLETKIKHPGQFIPFSVGPRNCVGFRFAMMSLKVTLSTIIRHLRVCPASELKGKPADFELSYGITMKDADDFPVIFQLRD